jgi:hypothetical protein
MNWRIENACRIESTEVDATLLWNVDLVESALRDLAIGFCLLWNELISRVDAVDVTGRRAMRIVRAKQQNSQEALVSWDGESATIILSSTELEALMHFFLRTVRDRGAEVDHLDIDACPTSAGGRAGNFVLRFPHATGPVSAEEARRRLGL